MFGVVMAMVMSVGGAATVLTVLARKNAPGDGWREALHAAVTRHREDGEALDDAVDDGAETAVAPASEVDVEPVPELVDVVEDVHLDEIFEIAEAPPEPAYTQASLVQHYIERVSPTVVRWTSPAVARVTPAVHRMTPVVTKWSALAHQRIEPALDKLRRTA